MTSALKVRSSKADATVRKIVNESLKRIIQHGESGLSMTDISRDLGISRPTIYRYFPSREALLEGVFEFILDDYFDKLQAQIDAKPATEERVNVIVDFAVARLKDGGAQMFQLEPKLVMGLLQQSEERLLRRCEQVFQPLFDVGESISGKPIDRATAARTFMLFSSALAFFNADTGVENAGEMLRSVIRGLI
mgnify:CR=1 FL=1